MAVKEGNLRIEITLRKELVKAMDGILSAINSNLIKGEPQFTRSKLISIALCTMINDSVNGAKIELDKRKEN